ncbi:DHH family phosphoesterase [Lachnoclostridium sp. Marseille-P6806]|uniref:DHH family phosphoesterase n=1 Tax=Lachnoclostridium sp. Marseille-P6806 TaxID=2364793 RepID=UPI001030C284|nr:bifunctional oligoribonuclease/PAP phosphatase NrnA [Lachnoclostridium sp. Marseille-P6806]
MRILEEIRNAKTVGISGHVNPDGDAVGSAVGLGLFIEKALPGARVDIFAEDFKESLREYMPATDRICFEPRADVSRYDVFIAVDTADDRLGDVRPFFRNAVRTINIDHHESNTGCAMTNYIYPDASSTCELVYDLIMKETLPDGKPAETLLDEPIARALYIGLITDTGVFRYANTSEHTMRVGGHLLRFLREVEPGELIDGIFYKKSYIQHQILGRALLESMLIRGGTCIVSVIDRRTMSFYHAESKDMDGIVSQLMLTSGVHVAIFLYEIAPLTYKVSLRSDGCVNVANIAAFYGGGGHDRAAGCTINAPYHDIINNISDSIDIQLDRIHGR